MPDQLLSTKELAARWGLNPGTLENWRSARQGPRFTRIGRGKHRRVLYPLDQVVRYEKKMTVRTRG